MKSHMISAYAQHGETDNGGWSAGRFFLRSVLEAMAIINAASPRDSVRRTYPVYRNEDVR